MPAWQAGCSLFTFRQSRCPLCACNLGFRSQKGVEGANPCLCCRFDKQFSWFRVTHKTHVCSTLGATMWLQPAVCACRCDCQQATTQTRKKRRPTATNCKVAAVDHAACTPVHQPTAQQSQRAMLHRRVHWCKQSTVLGPRSKGPRTKNASPPAHSPTGLAEQC